MSGCDTLDIHGIGKIQDHGYIVSLNTDSLDVQHVSSNVLDLPFCTSGSLEDLIGCGADSCFSIESSDHMESMIDTLDSRTDDPGEHRYSVDSYFDVDGSSYMFSLYQTLSEYVFSIYPDSPPRYDTGTMYTNLIQSMLSSTTQSSLFDESCTFITDMVGYDRAMVYKFKEDLSGEVVHEWIDPSMHGQIEPYIGMHFPESDIPLPARLMYLLKPIRVIHDTSSVPIDVIGSKTLDLSKCILRASHDVHTTYMKNMGVRSSLSLAIIVDSDLWGILSFHSYSKVCLPTKSSSRIIESMSRPFSMVLKNMITIDYTTREKTLSSVLDRLLGYEETSKYLSENHLELLKITGSDSVHINTEGVTVSWGGMEKEHVEGDMIKLKKRASRDGFYIGELKKPTRGIAYIFNGAMSLVFYRRSVDTSTIWGGDPNHVKIRRPDGVPGPRGSFERYILKNEGVLKPWTRGDKELIRFMSSRIKLFLESRRVSQSLIAMNTAPSRNPITYNTVNSKKVDSSLLTHISHEMFTPLNGISNTLTILMEDQSMPRGEMESLLGQGIECVKSIKTSMEGVLSITGVEPSYITEAQVKKEYTTIDDIGEAVVSRYSNRLRNNGIAFSYDSSVGRDHSALVGNDISTITKSVFSAMDNSVRFTESGGSVSYSVSYNHTHREAVLAWSNSVSDFDSKHVTNIDSVIEEDDSRTWYTFTVRDTGCGIHQDMINNVVATIDPLSGTVGKDIQKSHQGMGISMYKGMLDILKMNGSVGIASGVGTGTVISFILPISEGKALVMDTNTPDVTEGVIFVVDDSSLNRKMTSRLLKMACKKSLGFEPRIREFSDGRVCLMEVCKLQEIGKKPICIIMDYHMPIMSGKEATENIRRAEKEKGLGQIPIVGYTADVTKRTRKELLSSGMDNVISKPISIDVLTEMCDSIYNTRKN